MRKPVGGIVAVYIVATLVFSGLMLVLQEPSGIDPGVLFLVMFGPALGAVFTWAVFRRKLTELLPAARPGAAVLARIGWAVLACAVLFGVLVAVEAVRGESVAGAKAVAGVPFALVMVIQLVGAFGEEIGWRGLLQPVLETRFAFLPASVITGLIWGAWHVQVFADLAVAALFLVATVALSILMARLTIGSAPQRFTIAAVVHWLVNISVLVVHGERGGTVATTAGMTIAALVACAVVLVVVRSRGGSEPNSGMPSAPPRDTVTSHGG